MSSKSLRGFINDVRQPFSLLSVEETLPVSAVLPFLSFFPLLLCVPLLLWLLLLYFPVYSAFPLALSTPAGTICFHCGDFCGLPPLPPTQILRILEIRRIENTFILSALLVLLLLGILWSFLSGSVNGALIVATKCSKCQYFDARDPDSLPYHAPPRGALIDCPVSNQAKRPAQSQNLSRFHLFCSKIVRNLTPYRRLTQPLSMC